jgi:hypothetical protein
MLRPLAEQNSTPPACDLMLGRPVTATIGGFFCQVSSGFAFFSFGFLHRFSVSYFSFFFLENSEHFYLIISKI